MVVYAMAVGAQNYALLNFFQSLGVLAIADKLINAAQLSLRVYVVKIQRGWMVEPALGAVQRGFKCFPCFTQRRPFLFGLCFDLFAVALVVRS